MPGNDVTIKIGAIDNATNVLQNIAGATKNLVQQFIGPAAVVGAFYEVDRAIQDSIKGMMDFGTQMTKMHTITGISTDTLQKLKFAAEQGDVSFDQVGMSLKFLTRNMYEAQHGNAEMISVFQSMGVAVTDVVTGQLRPAENVFDDVAKYIRGMSNDTDAAALSIKVFGKTGEQVMPLLKSRYKEVGEMAEKLGFIIKENDIKAADQFEKTVKVLNMEFKAMSQGFATQLIPYLQQIDTLFIKTSGDTQAMGKSIAAALVNALSISGQGTADMLIKRYTDHIMETRGKMAEASKKCFDTMFSGINDEFSQLNSVLANLSTMADKVPPDEEYISRLKQLHDLYPVIITDMKRGGESQLDYAKRMQDYIDAWAAGLKKPFIGPMPLKDQADLTVKVKETTKAYQDLQDSIYGVADSLRDGLIAKLRETHADWKATIKAMIDELLWAFGKMLALRAFAGITHTQEYAPAVAGGGGQSSRGPGQAGGGSYGGSNFNLTLNMGGGSLSDAQNIIRTVRPAIAAMIRDAERRREIR
jgi:hypothetical protein